MSQVFLTLFFKFKSVISLEVHSVQCYNVIIMVEWFVDYMDDRIDQIDQIIWLFFFKNNYFLGAEHLWSSHQNSA